MNTNKQINLLASEEQQIVLKELSASMPDIILNDRQICDFELLATGVFSPLTGFMKQIDYESVLDRMRLESGELWPVPICLDIQESLAATLETGQSAALRDPEGFLLGIMDIQDIWPLDIEKESHGVYNTLDKNHPGVDYLFNKSGKYYIGGKIQAINLPIHSDFKQIRNTPVEVRNIFSKLGWKRVVGFQTRQPLHRPQFEMTIQAMRKARANLLLLPIAGVSMTGDFDHFTRMRCYQKVVDHYPPESYVLNLLPLAMRMAGPREAILHMIIGRNYGCTHFVIGHQHASPGNGSNKESYYKYDEAIKFIQENIKELGMEIITFEEQVYLPFEDEYKPVSQIPENADTISFSGTDIQKRIRRGKNVPEWATFPEVLQELRKAYPPPLKQGFTVFCTGLSGAGKSTIAKVLYSQFLEMGTRPVTLLDGDIVRRNLSSELNFSKEHRDINVKRIGYVASEITKNRGIAICAPIAPYENTRSEIRKSIEDHGGFFEVHVSTPVTECEKRDRKGMYAKARAGLLKGFTGVDDPYETPSNPELSIDTTDLTPDEAAREVMLYISQKGYI
jgi:sulfate adenylyltransferase